MASIETLIAQIENEALREKLAREVSQMKRRLDWGLVFERHLPENVRALSAPIKVGSIVWERRSATPRPAARAGNRGDRFGRSRRAGEDDCCSRCAPRSDCAN